MAAVARGLAEPDTLPPPRRRSLPVAGALTLLAAAIIAPPRVVAKRQCPHPAGHYSALLATDEPVRSGRLTKATLVVEVAHAAGLTKKDAEIIVDTVLGNIVEALHRGEKVELRGFGSFRLRRRESRRGRNPKTGERVDVPPRRVPYFKAGKELKELINREPSQPMPPLLSE